MVVVTGGVGKLRRDHPRRARHRRAQQGASSRRSAPCSRKVAILVLVILFLQRRPAGLFAAEGRNARSVSGCGARLARRSCSLVVVLPRAQRAAAGLAAARLRLHPEPLRQVPDATRSSPSASTCIWGYTGVLSLGHGVFFGLGAYAMGMHLMLEIGTQSVYQNALPDFMVWNQVKELPLFWRPFYSVPVHAARGRGGAGAVRPRLRLPRLPQPHPRRVLLDHHPGPGALAPGSCSTATR